MYDAANEIFVAFGIAPFDQAIPGIAEIIAKHDRLRATEPERARAFLADVQARLAKQKGKPQSPT